MESQTYLAPVAAGCHANGPDALHVQTPERKDWRSAHRAIAREYYGCPVRREYTLGVMLNRNGAWVRTSVWLPTVASIRAGIVR